MDVNYFIDKFEKIPEEKWCTGNIINSDGQSCANGHCGVRSSNFLTGIFGDESASLKKVLSGLIINHTYGGSAMDKEGYSLKAAAINNGNAKEYQQPTPKQRILAALMDIKQMQAVEQAKEIIKADRQLESA